MFFGLGADGTVGANKNSIKIIGEETENYGKGYFVYDSKKSGAITISHLRFGPRPIRSSYLVKRANFVACHQFVFLDKYDVLAYAGPGRGVPAEHARSRPTRCGTTCPREVQEQIIEKKLKFYVIDAYEVAKATGMGTRINTIMQTCFFAISGVLPRDEAIAQIKKAIKKTYGKRGEEVVQKNFAAVDETLANLHEVKVPATVTATQQRPPLVSPNAPDFVQRVTADDARQQGRPAAGQRVPGGRHLADRHGAVGEAQHRARDPGLGPEDLHPVQQVRDGLPARRHPREGLRVGLRSKGAPATFKSMDFKGAEFKGMKYTIQVAPEDCTGCSLCVEVCPAKDKTNPKHKAIDMTPQRPLREAEAANYEFFLNLPEVDRSKVKLDVKGTQFLQPLFEYSGACAAAARRRTSSC